MDNKEFWKAVKPFFSDKSQFQNKTFFIAVEKIISNNVEVAETMSERFVTVIDALGINENFTDENATDGVTDPSEKAIKIFESSQRSKDYGSLSKCRPFRYSKGCS